MEDLLLQSIVVPPNMLITQQCFSMFSHYLLVYPLPRPLPRLHV